ncbi:MAG TPA: hypothetical protein VN132_14325 [Bdellovibrio sp.]|nr:hypothetical protein [Bdellovibrio sp.]
METRRLKLVMAILTLISILSFKTWGATPTAQGLTSSAANVSNVCRVAKGSKLAMDQRDDARMSCLKQKKSELTVTQCLGIANSMEYTTTADDARLVCMSDLRHKITAKECLTITKAMEFPDSGDEARWDCLRRFSKSLSSKQCRSFAKDMSYPANTQRAEQFCSEEL